MFAQGQARKTLSSAGQVDVETLLDFAIDANIARDAK